LLNYPLSRERQEEIQLALSVRGKGDW